jgi:hypothetical protein
MTSKASVKKIYKQLLKKGVINSKVTLGDVWNKQIGGSHYQKFKIQPSKFVVDNKLLYPEGCVIKYIIRHSMKNGKEDLLKAKHFIDMIIERDYS